MKEMYLYNGPSGHMFWNFWGFTKEVFNIPRKTVQVVTVFEVSLVGYEGGFKNPNFEVVCVRKSSPSEAVSWYLEKKTLLASKICIMVLEGKFGAGNTTLVWEYK